MNGLYSRLNYANGATAIGVFVLLSTSPLGAGLNTNALTTPQWRTCGVYLIENAGRNDSQHAVDKFYKNSVNKDQEFLQYAFSVTFIESNFNRLAVSHAKARGLMQVTEVAAKDASEHCNLKKGADLHDAGTNIKHGTCYLDKLLKFYGGDWTTTLIAYNGGYRQADKYLQGKNVASESANYVLKVKRTRQRCLTSK